MSSPQDTTSPVEGGGLSRDRWVFIVIPVCVVLGIAILALVMTMMRRRLALGPPGSQGLPRVVRGAGRRGGTAGGPPPQVVYSSFRGGLNGGSDNNNNRRHAHTYLYYNHHAGGRNHHHHRRDRDLEETLTRGFRPAGGAQAFHLGGGGGGGHHRQPRVANRWAWANGRAFGRREEGLNELGEAPPPYAGRLNDEEGKPVTEGVELSPLPGHDGSNNNNGDGGGGSGPGGEGDGGRTREEDSGGVQLSPSPRTGSSEGGDGATLLPQQWQQQQWQQQQRSPRDQSPLLLWPLPPEPVVVPAQMPSPAATTASTVLAPPASASASAPVPAATISVPAAMPSPPPLESPPPPAYTERPATNTPGVRTSVTEIVVPDRVALGPERRA